VLAGYRVGMSRRKRAPRANELRRRVVDSLVGAADWASLHLRIAEARRQKALTGAIVTSFARRGLRSAGTRAAVRSAVLGSARVPHQLTAEQLGRLISAADVLRACKSALGTTEPADTFLLVARADLGGRSPLAMAVRIGGRQAVLEVLGAFWRPPPGTGTVRA
jgi:hypothetical protein